MINNRPVWPEGQRMKTNNSNGTTKKGRSSNPNALTNSGNSIWNPLTQSYVAQCRYYALKNGTPSIPLNELTRNSHIQHDDFSGTLSEEEWLAKYQPLVSDIPTMFSDLEVESAEVATEVEEAVSKFQQLHNERVAKKKASDKPDAVVLYDHLLSDFYIAEMCLHKERELRIAAENKIERISKYRQELEKAVNDISDIARKFDQIPF